MNPDNPTYYPDKPVPEPPDPDPQLLPQVRQVLADRFNLRDPSPHPESSPYETSLAMKAGMQAIRDISLALAERMGDAFWDGGDDIDYTNAAGELIQKLCTAVAFEYETHDMTLMLNRIASFIPNLEDAPHDDLDDCLSTAGCGGFASPLLDAIVECLHTPTTPTPGTTG